MEQRLEECVEATRLTKGIASHDFGLTELSRRPAMCANRLWLSWYVPCGKR